MTFPSEKPALGTIHTAASIQELKENLSFDKVPESTPPSCVFNSQAPENKIPVTQIVRDIKLATLKIPQITVPEYPEEETTTDDGPDAA